MEVQNTFLSTLQELEEEDDDINHETGELTAKGLRKLKMLQVFCKYYEQQSRIEKEQVLVYQDRFQQSASVLQEKAKKVFIRTLKKYGRNYCKCDDNLENYVLKLKLNNKNDFELFKELNKTKYPSIKYISIGFIENMKIYEVKKFLSKSFPSKISTFEFNYSKRPTESWDLVDLSDYIENFK